MELTDENFEEEVLEHEGPAFVNFWGSWCTACQRMEPAVGEIKVLLNIDKNPQVSDKYDIEETPTHILFENGEIVERRMGAMAKKQLERLFEGAL